MGSKRKIFELLALKEKLERNSHFKKAKAITQEIMIDPVICTDGNSYERTAIQEWLNINNTSPLTGEILSSINLIPNHTLRNVIICLQEQQNKEHKAYCQTR